MVKSPAIRGFTTDSAIPISTTRPDELLGHWVSDEHLQMLSMSRRDGLLEAFWAFFGIALGSIIPACVALSNAFTGEIDSRTPLTLAGFIQSMLCGASILLAIALLILWKIRGNRSEDLIAQIRGRKRNP